MKRLTLMTVLVGGACMAAGLAGCGAPVLLEGTIVDQRARTAGDENAGTVDMPLATISAAVAKAAPGDVITVRAGTYPELVKIAASGAEGKPITLQAAPGERVVIGGSGDGRHGITWAAGAGHLRIRGFEVSGGRGIGSTDKGGHHIEISECVVLGAPIRLMGHSDCVVRRCVQGRNKGNGVSLNGCTRCTVEECEIFDNYADGLVVTHGSDGCAVRRNFIHNHWYAHHPDALQIYRTVTHLTVEGNLLFNSGQGFMMEQADGGVFRNNMMIGTHHSGLLLGHRNTHNWTVEGNTIAYTGFKAVTYSGHGTVFRNNIILAGGDSKLLEKAGADPCKSDYNLYWKPEGRDVVYHVPEGEDQHSKFADPRFRSAPTLLGVGLAVYYIDVWGDKEAAAKSTPGKLYLIGRPLTDRFVPGDHVECNFDGKVRKVTEVAADYVAFEPPLEKRHHHPWDVIVNWEDKADFTWDCTLADDSPARGMGDKGQNVGSSIDMRAWMKCDFDGDGRRDLPRVPEDLLTAPPDWKERDTE